LKTLFDGMMKSLENSVKAPPWQEKRGSGEWTDKRSAELEFLAQQLKAQRGDIQSDVEAGYGERRADIRNVVVERKRRLEAYAGRNRQVIPAKADKFIIAGRVTDQASGVGLPNVKVNAFDLDRKQHDFLGNARTDSLGYFRVEYTEKDFMDAGEEKQPETFIEVMGEDGKVIHTSTQSFVQKAGEVEFVKVEVDGKLVSKSLDAGQRIDESVKMRINGLETRERLLSTREAALLPIKPATAAKPAVKRSATTKTTSRASAGVGKAEAAATSTTSTKKKTAIAKSSTARAKKPAATRKSSAAKAKTKPTAEAKASTEASDTASKKAAASSTRAAGKKTTSKSSRSKKPGS
jgi:hypothetical protein